MEYSRVFHLNEVFCEAVQGRIVGHAVNVLDSISFLEVSKLFGVNYGLLSETSCSRKLCFASSDCKAAIVLGAVVEDIGMTSSHLECASTNMRNILSRKGPAKLNALSSMVL